MAQCAYVRQPIEEIRVNVSDEIPSRVSDRRLWQIQPLRDLAGLLTIVGALWLLYDFRRLLAPVLIAIVLAYVCDPLLSRVRRIIPSMVAGLDLSFLWAIIALQALIILIGEIRF